MDRFPGKLYQIDAETLRALYRLSNRLNDTTVMTPDERRNLAQRMHALLRKSEQVE
jgi:hypothetical protein